MTERDDVAVLWDMPIQRVCEIGTNRSDIVIRGKKEKKEFFS